MRIPILLSMVLLAACSNGGSAPEKTKTKATTTTTTTVTAPAAGDAAAKATDIFAQRCTPCHGAEGRGDGAASASLNPHPRNFHDVDWQTKVSDEHLIQIIKMGGAAVGLSPAMPANPDLKDEAVLAALKDHIRSLGGQP